MRTKTLIAPILLHGLLNLSGGIFAAFTSSEYTISQAKLDDVIVIALTEAFPLIIATFVLLRKVKPEDIAENAPQINNVDVHKKSVDIESESHFLVN